MLSFRTYFEFFVSPYDGNDYKVTCSIEGAKEQLEYLNHRGYIYQVTKIDETRLDLTHEQATEMLK